MQIHWMDILHFIYSSMEYFISFWFGMIRKTVTANICAYLSSQLIGNYWQAKSHYLIRFLFHFWESSLKSVVFFIGYFLYLHGVSGSGKSSLVNEVLFKRLGADLNRMKCRPGKHTFLSNNCFCFETTVFSFWNNCFSFKTTVFSFSNDCFLVPILSIATW